MTLDEEHGVNKTRILVVCLGNICRSPMAEGIFLDRVRRRGWSDRVAIDSAGTAAYHAGEPPDPRTLAELGRHGIALDCRARQVQDDDFERFDWILAMDSSNFDRLRQRCPAERRDRVAMMLEPVGGGDVADPYYGGLDGFARNFQQLDRAVDAWLDRIQASATP